MPASSLPPSYAPALALAAVSPGRFVDRFGGRFFEIARAEALPPFFMNIATASDLWLFVASNGGLTAGRGDADHALFPYQPVDRIYDSASSTGPTTAIWVHCLAEPPVLWEPFAAHTGRVHQVTRRLFKSIEGDRIWFEEVNHGLRVAFRYGWSTTAEFGLIRTAELENFGEEPVRFRLVDGFRHLLVPGVTRRLQEEYSCLADAYKMAERVAETTLAVYALASGITDRPVPLESLRATIAWCEGLPDPTLMLSDAQLGAFLQGDHPVASESLRRGVRASYLVASELTLDAGGKRCWTLGADTNRTAVDVAKIQLQLEQRILMSAVAAADRHATRRLRHLVGAADGLQAGADEAATVHHFANVLFNVMRGGVFVANHDVPGRDFAAFVELRHKGLAARHVALLAQLPERLPRGELLETVAQARDPQLERLALEYLPLIFSRRHGDPSRPWNRFQVRVGTESSPVLHYEGNWRDIFQNWEALGWSFPEFLDGMVATFVNASTVDGYNPYRLTRGGIEWEVPNPEDPWSSIGYWGDHQVIYLLKLLEAAARFFPGRLERWLRRELFTYAAVPYRIGNYEQLCRDPRHTITFLPEVHAEIERRVAEEGADARLVRGPDGAPRQVNLTEKLLLLVLTRLVNFVPEGGIWMNTQRPEWNDGNNALVGAGVSVVTLAYLRRFLAYLRDMVGSGLGAEPVRVNEPLAALADEVVRVLHEQRGQLAGGALGDEARRAIVDQLGRAGSSYRDHVYAQGVGTSTTMEPSRIQVLIELALEWVDHTLRSNRRSDGLYHAYNLLEFHDEKPLGTTEADRLETQASPPSDVPEAAAPRRLLGLARLPVMLEGQVAILSAGLLRPEEAAEVVTCLRRSELYRHDQDSFLLHPDRDRPGFLARGVIPRSAIDSIPWLTTMIEAGETRLVTRDARSVYRFASHLVNAAALDATLAALGTDPRWVAGVKQHATNVKRLYEDVFNHRGFTGRSGAMFGYEGLGSIYWHMVSKLLLAVQENLERARRAHDPAAERLARAYEQVREGLGFCKEPATYGAFPTDPYSHTPAHAGAQQPGMTGQVKEEILARWGELGVTVEGGRLSFDPRVVAEREFLKEPAGFFYVSITGEPASLALPAGALGFTVCGTPVVYRRGRAPWHAAIHFADGEVRMSADLSLAAAVSAEVFARSGAIQRIELTSAGPVFNGSLPEMPCEAHSSFSSPWSARSQ